MQSELDCGKFSALLLSICMVPEAVHSNHYYLRCHILGCSHHRTLGVQPVYGFRFSCIFILFCRNASRTLSLPYICLQRPGRKRNPAILAFLSYLFWLPPCNVASFRCRGTASSGCVANGSGRVICAYDRGRCSCGDQLRLQQIHNVRRTTADERCSRPSLVKAPVLGDRRLGVSPGDRDETRTREISFAMIGAAKRATMIRRGSAILARRMVTSLWLSPGPRSDPAERSRRAIDEMHKPLLS